MAEFINTADVIGDDEMCDQIIQRTVTEYKENRITKIGPRAFCKCTALTTVDVPNATSVGTYAFNGCTALTSIDLPNVVSIDRFAFDSCSGLTNVVLPSTTGELYLAFQSATKLVSIKAPLVQTVNDSSFRHCSSLQYLDFGAVTAIKGNWVFQDAPIKALIIRTNAVCTLTINTSCDLFTNTGITAGTGYIYVPRALVDSYKAATNWSNYAAQFRALEDYTVDGTVTGDLDESKI